MLALATAFRLFFLMAGILAAVAIPVWVSVYTSGGNLSSNLAPLGWHAHEMVFGYTGAVLAGFLLTAAANWTKRSTLSGGPLGVLALLWLAGRAATLHSANLPPALPPVIDGLFFLGLAVAIARPIVLARKWRNVVFPILVIVIGICDVTVHLHVLGVMPVWSARALDLALDAIALILVIFGARVIPMFTRNGTKTPVRDRGGLDHVAVASLWIYTAVHAVVPGTTLAHAMAIAAGILNAARLVGWGGSRTLRQPILWVLHLGWLLLSVGITLRGLNGLAVFAAPSAILHVFTIGGIGLLTLGMMARVSLGHTGRALQVPRVVAAGFVALLIATGARLAATMVPMHFASLLWVAAIAWAAAFAAFVFRYAPILLSPRVDGKHG